MTLLQAIEIKALAVTNWLTRNNIHQYKILIIVDNGQTLFLVYTLGRLSTFGYFFPIEDTLNGRNGFLFTDEEGDIGFWETGLPILFDTLVNVCSTPEHFRAYIISNSEIEVLEAEILVSASAGKLDDLSVSKYFDFSYSGITSFLKDSSGKHVKFLVSNFDSSEARDPLLIVRNNNSEILLVGDIKFEPFNLMID